MINKIALSLLFPLSISPLAYSATSPVTTNINAENGYLSTHVLDTSLGKGADGVEVKLFRYGSKQWQLIDTQRTDENGRIKRFTNVELGSNDAFGKYKLEFSTEKYYQLQNKNSFYPIVNIEFYVDDNTHYHVPITLTQYGFATYRGS
ncbi:hydroxyisourate hydrolase [Aeromonas sp. 11P]|uniref:hydroxyisourate hydrolase n=1 Tax=Aeromonas sp. 11P TaxID=3452713 RepID=UPI003F7965A7